MLMCLGRGALCLGASFHGGNGGDEVVGMGMVTGMGMVAGMGWWWKWW